MRRTTSVEGVVSVFLSGGGAAPTWSMARWSALLVLLVAAVGVEMSALTAATFTTRTKGDPGKHDNAWCFKGVYDYDNCPEKGTLLACVRCCSELKTYYEKPPSKNVCLAACADRFPKLGIEWIYP